MLPGRPRAVGVAASVTAAYFVSAKLGFAFAFVAEQVTTVWAPAGIAQAALLVWGTWLWAPVWLGAFLANAFTDAPVWAAIVIATGNTLAALVVTLLLPRSQFDPGLTRVSDAVQLIVVGALLAPAISATIGVSTLCMSAVQPWDRFTSLWWSWWVGDALGALVVGPFLLTLMRSPRDRAGHPRLNIAAAVLLAMVTTELVFSAWPTPFVGDAPLHYVLFPLIVASAVRFGQPATAAVVLAVSVLAIGNTVRGAGPFATEDVNRGLLLLQAFTGILACTGLLLAAAISERRTVQRRVTAAHAVGEVLADAADLAGAATAILRRICEALRWQFGAIWIVDDEGRALRCFATWDDEAAAIEPFRRTTAGMTFARGSGLPGRVWASGHAVWIEDVVRDRNFPRAPAALRAGIHGGFGFPIRVGGEVVGVIEFFTHRIAAPDNDLLAAMSTIGNQVGQFIGRKRSEAAAADEQRGTRAILEAALDAVIAIDHRGVVTSFNPAAERMFGYSRETAVGRDLADLVIPPDLRAHHRAGLQRFLETGEGPFLNRRVETRGYHVDGHEFPIEVAITILSGGGPPRFTGYLRDLTEREQAEHERRQAEEALRVSEERFRSLAASSSVLTLFEQDRELRYRWVFPQHPTVSSHNIGRTDEELLPDGEGRRLTELKRSVLETGVGRREEIVVTLDGKPHYYDLVIEPRRRAGEVIGVGGVAVDITERKRQEQMLRDSQAQLRDADRRKDEFLAILAHELRNPLAPVRTGLQALKLAGDDAATIQKLRPMMERQIGHMARLIDDLLDVSRITSGKIYLQKEPAVLADIVGAAVDANRDALDASGAELSIDLPAEPIALFVDPTRMIQVLSNLLHNAAKFTGRGGRITVAGRVAETGAARELHLIVADSGAGIDSRLLPHVFELFTQGEPPSRSGSAGLGVGLALSRLIVELHGGRIDARSAGPGQGSEFHFWIPIPPSAAPFAVVESTPAAAAAPVAVVESAPAAAAPPVNRRVLVVDDNADAAEMTAWLVRAVGGEARTAGDGPAAIQLAREFDPDVVLLDIGLPGMDGYAACKAIRELMSGRQPFMVAITGFGQDRDKRRAAEAGFDVHLTKPVDPTVLERVLIDPATHRRIESRSRKT